MYTLYGLKMIVENNQTMVKISYFKDAISNLEESFNALEKGLMFLEEKFQKNMKMNTHFIKEKIEWYLTLAKKREEVAKELFLEVYQLAVETGEKETEIFNLIDEEFKQLNFKKIEPKYLVLKANHTGIHKLGFLEYSFDEFITVQYETDNYYMGSFWYSNFFNVKFQKSNVRELTEEEKKQENVS